MVEYTAILEFSGKKGERDAKRWVNNLEMVLADASADEEVNLVRFIRILDSKLIGEASGWANRTPACYMIVDKSPTAADTDILKEIFLGKFGVRRPDPIAIIDELRALRQEQGGTGLAYYYRTKRILCQMILGKDLEDGTVLGSLNAPEKLLMQQIVNAYLEGLPY